MDTSITTDIVQKAGWAELFAGSNKYKAIGLALGVVLHVTNIYLSATIMPSIVAEIGGLAYYAWNTTAFVVASIIGSVISANGLARLGPRKSYRQAIIFFGIGTVICMASPTMYVMLLGRFIQGIGGGLLFALSYAMIRIVFEPALWVRGMALVSGMWGIGAFTGPLIGGIFAQYGHWRLAFAAILLISIILLLIIQSALPAQHEGSAPARVPYMKLTWLVLAALSVSIGGVMESITANIAGVGIALLFMGILVSTERVGSIRLLPTGAYRFFSPLGAIYVVAVLLTIVAAIEIFIPYFAQTIQGFSPLEAGYVTILVAMGWTAASLIFAGMPVKFLRTLTLAGAVLMLMGLSGLTYLASKDNSIAHLILMCVSLLLVGAGIGSCWPHLIVHVFSWAPAGEQELTSSSITTVQLIAMTFGAALGGVITNAGGMTVPGGLEGASRAATLLYSTFLAAPVLVLLVLAVNRYYGKMAD